MRRGAPRRGAIATLLAAVVALFLIPGTAAAEPALPAGFQDEVVFDGLEQPTNFRFAPDGRVFVAEKPGRIKVFDDLEDPTPEVFADLRGSVYDNGDRGLLGLELDPEFEVNGRVYALYTWDHVLGEAWDPNDPAYGTPGVSGDPGCPAQNSSSSCLVSGRLVLLTEDELSPNQAVEEGGLPKESQLLEGWCQQFSSHSVGELEFGPEGALYVSGGDGASFESIPDYGQLGTPPNPCGDAPTPAGTAPSPVSAARGGALRSQNLELLNGAILRIDPETGEAFDGNPLAASPDENTQRTVAKGFRNPFRFTTDPQSGEIYVSNVGSSEIEEIDRFEAPATALFNSGWPCFEGIVRHYQYQPLGLDLCEAMYEDEPDSASLPFFSYSHRQSVVPDDECPTESGSAIGGITIYEGGQFPDEYEGALFFADAVRGCIWVMFEGEGEDDPDPSTTRRFLREGRIYPGLQIVEGPDDGYLYYATLFSDEGAGDGEIHRIAYRPDSPIARLEADPAYGPYDGGDEFETTVDASQSTDPNGDPLTYEWDLDEDGVYEISGSDQTQPLTFTKAEQEAREKTKPFPLSPNRVVAVRVSDGTFSSVARVTVYPGDQPPAVTITKPTSAEQWSVGDLVKLEGKGVGAKGEITEPLFYYWATRMAHCPDPTNPSACHVHPLETFSGVRRPEFVAPQHDYPSYIEVLLRVSSPRGLSGTATLKFQPRTVDLSLVSDPPGIPLLAATTEAVSPFTVPAIDGSEILISAPGSASLGGRTYTFAGWSDGGGREHPILVSSAQTTYTAAYTTPAVDPPPAPAPPPAPPVPPKPPATVPQTKVKRHPPAKTTKRKATFTFSSSVRGSTFRCKLDRKRPQRCRSPKTYRGLKPGRHTFKVWAISGVLRDRSPAKFSWKVLRSKRRR